MFIVIRVVFDATKVMQNPTPFNGETQEYVVKIKEAIFFSKFCSTLAFIFAIYFIYVINYVNI
ncbi:hypothetical protein DTQ70_20020 [Runella sp. SP2]|nr:hypothetical protein DTQ70_20020 [Runella sp. SP2]